MDARPYRPNRHPAMGIENIIPPGSKNIHQRHKSTGNILNMPAPGNVNLAPKRTALADRNAMPREKEDAQHDIKYGNIQNYNGPATMISQAQENRAQANTKNVLKKGLSQPAQRPPKTVAPSASMSQLKSGIDDAHPRPRLPSRASIANFVNIVHSDLQKGKPKPAPAASSKEAPEDLRKAKPSNTVTKTDIKQELLGLTSAGPQKSQLGQDRPQDQEQTHRTRDAEAHGQKHNFPFTQSSLAPVGEAPSPDVGYPDGDLSESLYLDAAEDLTEEQIQFLTNAPAQFSEQPSWPEVLPRHLPADPRIVDRANLTGLVPATDETEYSADGHPPGLVDDHPYSSDYDEEDYRYDDRACTTTHSSRSRGDNTTGGVTTVMLPPKLNEQGMAEIKAAKRFVDSRRTPDEIQEDAWDVSMVAEYGEEIFEYMKTQEMTLLPNPHYMDIQTEIQWSMRSVLMDWVVQVHTRFGLLPETLFLTVNYIDRFLSYKVVSLGKLQLVGATAIFIAAKYEEINCPSVQEIVFMVDGGYNVEEILKAERFMLSMLDFELGWPGPMSFLRRISKADDYDLETRTVAKYFLEVAIMDERFVASPPSYVAAGAHCLSRLLLRKGAWTPAHVHYSGYTYRQLKPLLSSLLDCCRHARQHHSAVFDKYSDKRYRYASSFVEEEIMKGFVLPFEQLPNMPFSMEFFCEEAPRRTSYGGSQAIKMPIPTRA
ncbi:hypothetical protein GGS20DRAFT_547526 [Poronia punctata]|nr:hypothetical protein GGS20DRAFT_547526 [Poronia punctata]